MENREDLLLFRYELWPYTVSRYTISFRVPQKTLNSITGVILCFYHSLFLGFFSLPRPTWPPTSGVLDMMGLRCAAGVLCSRSCLKWLHLLASLHFPASGARENKVHVILSCFVHGCLDSLTPRCTLPDFKVCSHLRRIILKWNCKNHNIFPCSAKADACCIKKPGNRSGPILLMLLL